MNDKTVRSNSRRLSRKLDTTRRPKPHRVHGNFYSHETVRTYRYENKRDAIFNRVHAESKLCACGNLKRLCCCADNKPINNPMAEAEVADRNIKAFNIWCFEDCPLPGSGTFVNGCYISL